MNELTLDAILMSYQAQTLANQPDDVLYDAQVKVALWHDWWLENPDYLGHAVPDKSTLRNVFDFLEDLLTVRYGCND